MATAFCQVLSVLFVDAIFGGLCNVVLEGDGVLAELCVLDFDVC